MAGAIIINGKVPLYHPLGGRLKHYEPDEARRLIKKGYIPQSAEEERSQRQAGIDKGYYEDKEWEAAALGLARGLTFGASDALIDNKEYVREVKEANPCASIGGEIASFAVPGAAPAKLFKGAAKLGAGAAARTGEGLLSKAVGGAVKYGTEGAALGMSQGGSDVALSEKALSAEEAVEHVLTSGVHGAAINMGLGVLGAGGRWGIGKVKGKITKPLKDEIRREELGFLADAEKAGIAAESAPKKAELDKVLGERLNGAKSADEARGLLEKMEADQASVMTPEARAHFESLKAQQKAATEARDYAEVLTQERLKKFDLDDLVRERKSILGSQGKYGKNAVKGYEKATKDLAAAREEAEKYAGAARSRVERSQAEVAEYQTRMEAWNARWQDLQAQRVEALGRTAASEATKKAGPDAALTAFRAEYTPGIAQAVKKKYGVKFDLGPKAADKAVLNTALKRVFQAKPKEHAALIKGLDLKVMDAATMAKLSKRLGLPAPEPWASWKKAHGAQAKVPRGSLDEVARLDLEMERMIPSRTGGNALRELEAKAAEARSALGGTKAEAARAKIAQLEADAAGYADAIGNPRLLELDGLIRRQERIKSELSELAPNDKLRKAVDELDARLEDFNSKQALGGTISKTKESLKLADELEGYLKEADHRLAGAYGPVARLNEEMAVLGEATARKGGEGLFRKVVKNIGKYKAQNSVTRVLGSGPASIGVARTVGPLVSAKAGFIMEVLSALGPPVLSGTGKGISKIWGASAKVHHAIAPSIRREMVKLNSSDWDSIQATAHEKSPEALMSETAMLVADQEASVADEAIERVVQAQQIMAKFVPRNEERLSATRPGVPPKIPVHAKQEPSPYQIRRLERGLTLFAKPALVVDMLKRNDFTEDDRFVLEVSQPQLLAALSQMAEQQVRKAILNGDTYTWAQRRKLEILRGTQMFDPEAYAELQAMDKPKKRTSPSMARKTPKQSSRNMTPDQRAQEA